MIIFTRLTGGAIAINPDLIERAEETPDTVITLVDDKKFLVSESLEQVIALISDYRSYVIARSQSLEITQVPHRSLELVPNETVAGSSDSLSADHLDDDQHDASQDARVLEFIDSLTRDHGPDPKEGPWTR